MPVLCGSDWLLTYQKGNGYPSFCLNGGLATYSYIWEGMVTNLPIHVGANGHHILYLLGKGWPPIYPSIWEEVAIDVQIYLRRDCHPSTYVFGCLFSTRKNYLLIFGKRNGHLFILCGQAWHLISPRSKKIDKLHISSYMGGWPSFSHVHMWPRLHYLGLR